MLWSIQLVLEGMGVGAETHKFPEWRIHSISESLPTP